jgi:hypothetical protein
MDEREFLVLARALALEASEAAWCTAFSRAYYAAFHVARRLMQGLGFVVPRADRAHAYLMLRLNNCGDPTTARAGNDLNALRRDRNWADYDLHLPVRQAMVSLRIQLAEQIIQSLDAAAVEPTRS